MYIGELINNSSANSVILILFVFSDDLSAENSKSSADFSIQLIQLSECMFITGSVTSYPMVDLLGSFFLHLHLVQQLQQRLLLVFTVLLGKEQKHLLAQGHDISSCGQLRRGGNCSPWGWLHSPEHFLGSYLKRHIVIDVVENNNIEGSVPLQKMVDHTSWSDIAGELGLVCFSQFISEAEKLHLKTGQI